MATEVESAWSPAKKFHWSHVPRLQWVMFRKLAPSIALLNDPKIL